MTGTKVDRELQASEAAHQDDEERTNLIRSARRFKASWVELAQALTEARRAGSYKRWGYPSLEEYAKKELHLRQETVDKLTGSFVFLKRRAPDVLARDGVALPIPSYQSVDFLRRAEEEPNTPKDVVQAIRKRVIDEGAGLSAVARQYREAVFPMAAGEKKAQDTAALRNVAKRLRELLDETKVVPRRLAGEVAGSLDRLLEALHSDENAAA
jgi:hypothetical protein